MYQLVAIGDITVDMFFQGKTLTQDKEHFNLVIGGKYYADAFHSGLGGSAANVSIHGAQLGLDSAVVSKVGENAFKNIVVQTLARKTVSTEFLQFDRDHVSISSILLSPSGERTVVKYSDPKDHIELGDHALERVKRSGIIFMGNLPYVSVAERTKFMKAVRSETNLLATNFGSNDCQSGLAKLTPLIEAVDVLFLNRYELGDLLGKKGDTLKLDDNQLKVLNTNLKMLVITDGSNGSYAYTSDVVYKQDAAKVTKVVDTTGAGDAFTAAFLVRYADNKNIQDSLAAAADYAAKIIGKIGAN